MKGYIVDDFAVLIGIDWADTKHDICENPPHSNTYQYSVIKSKPEDGRSVRQINQIEF